MNLACAKLDESRASIQAELNSIPERERIDAPAAKTLHEIHASLDRVTQKQSLNLVFVDLVTSRETVASGELNETG